MRRRLTTILVLALGFLLVTAQASLAASPHFKKGGEPVCTIAELSAASKSTTCSASLAGLGMGTLVINVTASGFAVYQCSNGGGNTAPGQNKVFTTNPAVLTAPGTVTGAQAGCPNPNWTGVNPVLTLTDVTMTIAQGGQLLFTCTASDPDGLSGTVALAC